MSVRLFVFYLEISGRETNEDQYPSKKLIETILSISHFEIFYIYFNDFHSINKYEISFVLQVFHLEISGKDFNDEQKKYHSYFLHFLYPI